MANYLVVAHQTATSPLLLERARELRAGDAQAAFTLLVPETHVQHRLVCDEDETRALAVQRAAEAKAAFEAAGLRVLRSDIGSASPIDAIHDELRVHRDEHDAIVLSTLAPGRSRWLIGDLPSRLVREQAQPVFHVYEGGDAAWAFSEPLRKLVAAGGGRRRRERAVAAPVAEPALFASARDLLPFAALLLLHLVLGVGLALRFDSMFLLGEAFIVTAMAALAIGLWRFGGPESDRDAAVRP